MKNLLTSFLLLATIATAVPAWADDVAEATTFLAEQVAAEAAEQRTLQAAVIRVKAANQDLSAAKLALKAAELRLRADQTATVPSDVALEARNTARARVAWREARVAAAKEDLTLQKARVALAKQRVLVAQADLERDQLRVQSDAGGDPAVDKQLGSASMKVARLRTAQTKKEAAVASRTEKRDGLRTKAENLAAAADAPDQRQRLSELEDLLASTQGELAAALAELEKTAAALTLSDAARRQAELDVELLRQALTAHALPDPTKPAAGSKPSATP